MLELAKAVELYLLLKPYLPDDDEGEAVQYVQQILSNSLESPEGPDAYVGSVELTHDIEVGEDQNPLELLSLFVEGLSENEIVSLKAFAQQIGL